MLFKESQNKQLRVGSMTTMKLIRRTKVRRQFSLCFGERKNTDITQIL